MKGIAILFIGLVLLSALACAQPEEETSLSPKMNADVYTGTFTGFSGNTYTVYVAVDPVQITSITFDSIPDSANVGQKAAPIMANKIVLAQTAEVDNVSGASVTSAGIKAAVKEALAKAGAPVSFTEAPKNPSKVGVTEDVNVLIIGSGIAGLSAAVQASTDKPAAKVVVIEKQEFIGGSTKLAAGVVLGTAATNPFVPPYTENTGDRAVLADFYMERAQGYAERSLVEFWANNSWATLVFLGLDQIFAVPSGTMTESRMRLPPSPGFVPGAVNSSGGDALVQMLAEKARNKGVRILTGVKATELITSGGAVTGVKAESKTANYTFKTGSNGSVIIATGGFDSDRSGNDSLMATYNPDSKQDIPQSSAANTGEGIKMAQKIGAATVFKGGKVGWVGIDVSLGEAMHYTSWIIKNNGELFNYSAPSAQSAGYVNNAGHPLPQALLAGNYASNPQDYAVNHRLMLEARKADPAVSFYAISRESPSGSPPPPASFIKSGAAVAALATAIGATETNLNAAFAAWEAANPSAENPPGSGTYNWTAASTYYAVKAIPSSIGSMGGIKINTNAEVLKQDGGVITGLYAAGECANGDMFYLEYPGSGSSLSISATFGRTAGAKAASKL
jgi:fumarate reductase flavoprotein subunit